MNSVLRNVPVNVLPEIEEFNSLDPESIDVLSTVTPEMLAPIIVPPFHTEGPLTDSALAAKAVRLPPNLYKYFYIVFKPLNVALHWNVPFRLAALIKPPIF